MWKLGCCISKQQHNTAKKHIVEIRMLYVMFILSCHKHKADLKERKGEPRCHFVIFQEN